MLLAQIFKSREGVAKRCAFENVHSTTHRFTAVRIHNGAPDTSEWRADRWTEYTYRISKERKS